MYTFEVYVYIYMCMSGLCFLRPAGEAFSSTSVNVHINDCIHVYTYVYIYIYVCIYVCKCQANAF
jgi:hypothetical protein